MSPRSELGISASSPPGLARRMPHGRELSSTNGTLSLAIYQIQDSREISVLISKRISLMQFNQPRNQVRKTIKREKSITTPITSLPPSPQSSTSD